MPFIESWLKKDQNDGTVERDMTSSLTGRDESFGSAHQNYQNSLIRKKKCDDEIIDINSNQKKLNSKFDRNENFNQPDVSLNNKEINYAKYEEKNKNDPTFDELDETGDFINNYHPKQIHSNIKNEENINRPFLNNLKNDKYIDIVPYKDILPNNRLTNSRANKDLSFLNENYGKWSANDKMKELYSNNPISYISRGNSLTGGNAMQNALSMSEKDISNNEYINDEPEGRNPQVENDYYDSETNPSITDNEFDEGNEYVDSFSGRSFLDKRDESAQQKSFQMNKYRNSANSQKAVYEAMKAMGHRAPSYQSNQIPFSEFEKNPNPSYQRNSAPNYLWNVNSNFQSKALQDVLKNSQKALKEVQLYQQKHLPALRSENNVNFDVSHEVKNFPMIQWASNNLRFDEKRLKREDEDEQKNMKTGTDEGGGGEYEDEEGKGHNDEEEYYEDADLSNNESGNEIHSADEVNKKLVKRELNTGSSLKNSKQELDDSASDDYTFNIENAPVENIGKSRKNFFSQEGEKTKKNSGRKGVKIWDQWGKWSPCSVTCGIGRSTRWRHCVGGGCAQGEKEAQIKRCTNPAC